MTRFDSLQAWLSWQEQCHPRPIDLGLERVAAVYHALNPAAEHIPTITVAGTNGKGSCIAYLEAIYRAQGYRVGAYTSPHILRYNERIRIDGQAVTDEAICDAFQRIDQLRGETSLSYFEFGTLAALDLFSREQVDVRLLEVGLGGRLDAVNMIDADVGLVTTIAIDHVDWLGHTLEEIGAEKAGIYRANKPAIIGDRQPPQSIELTVKQIGADYYALGKAFDYQQQVAGWDWQTAGIQYQNLPAPAFQGEHQYRNAAAVLMAVNALQEQLPITETAVRQGLQQANIQGRFQFIAGKPNVLLDVGHNPQAVQTLIDYLQQHFPVVKIHAVFAMMKDKDINGVLAISKQRVAEWYLAPLANPRAADDELLLASFKQQHIDSVHSGFADVGEALNAARHNALPEELILVFGSFFLVSEYLSKFA